MHGHALIVEEWYKRTDSLFELYVPFVLFVAKKASAAGTIMEPVFWSQPHSKHREVSPSLVIINPVCMKKVSSYNVRAF